MQPPRLKDANNYDVSDLRSEDETDDEDDPSKPIPSWATEPNLRDHAQQQFTHIINYTKLFRASSQAEIDLEQIFKIKRKKFNERSSSACWASPPVWKGEGLNGDESFWQTRKSTK